ncbi:MAG: hypothetical protein CTY31_09365 [Hyphomicrobium sp.]|nr:MAG: hypothetical protein CTY31_09365 [Hyphomicrobium sp.]
MTEKPNQDNICDFDCAKLHDPLVSIIVTHFNYSDHIQDALLSVLSQTHQNWECVVVDDCSNAEHRIELERIINKIGSRKIRLISTEENLGQTLTFFKGFETTSGEFVCLLDPDDRYAPVFIEKMLEAHLHEMIFCPLASCDQRLFKNGSVISGMNTHLKKRFLVKNNGFFELPAQPSVSQYYIPAGVEGWNWTTSSAIMFRRAAVNLARPYRQLSCRNSTDAYLAQGLHRLGGTIFVTSPLVYRGLHNANCWMTSEIYSSSQKSGRAGRKEDAPELLVDVIDAIRHNGGGEQLDRFVRKKKKNLNLLQKWNRSIRKSFSFLPK